MPFRPNVVIAILAATVVCGCSAAVINEDGPGWSLADKPPVVAPEPRNGVSASALEAGLPSNPVTGSRSGSTAPVAKTYDYRGGRDPVTGKAATEGPAQPQAGVPVVRKVKATTEPARSAAAAVPAAAAPTGAPATPAASVTPGTLAGNGSVAVVAKGDTLHALALKHRISVKVLMSANNLTNNIIFPGQKLVIPAEPR